MEEGPNGPYAIIMEFWLLFRPVSNFLSIPRRWILVSCAMFLCDKSGPIPSSHDWESGSGFKI